MDHQHDQEWYRCPEYGGAGSSPAESRHSRSLGPRGEADAETAGCPTCHGDGHCPLEQFNHMNTLFSVENCTA